MIDYIRERQELGVLLAQIREEAGLSQEEAATKLNVHRTTIMRWENGTSSPDMVQVVYYIEKVLHKSLRQLIYSYMHKQTSTKTLISMNEVNARKDLCKIVMCEMPFIDVNVLTYLWHGKHGSDPHAVTQLLAANIESPMSSRVINATAVLTNYEMALRGQRIPEDAPGVDFDALLSATQAGKTAAIENKGSYYEQK